MKIIKDYEVEGGWLSPNHISNCRKCDAAQELVPKRGHYNSQFQHLERDDGTKLMCCPNGCSVESAEYAFKWSGIITTTEVIKYSQMVFIDPRTFAGVGGNHFYGRMKLSDPKRNRRHDVDVSYTLTKEEANIFNRGEDVISYHAGDDCTRFFTETLLLEKAVEQYKQLYPKAKALICGESMVVEPQKVLDGPEDFKATINFLVGLAEDCSWWANEKRMQEISDQWSKFVEPNK